MKIRGSTKPWYAALLGLALLAGGADARPAAPPAQAASWIGSWGTAQMIAEGDNAVPPASAANVTLRQIVRLSAGGQKVRLRLSNMFGTQPLTIAAAELARATSPDSPAIAGGQILTFAGQPGAVIPAGAELYADPITLPVAPGADLAISLYLPAAAVPQTGHPGARATAYMLPGNHVADASLPSAATTTHWYAIADIEVSNGPAASAQRGSVVTIGDSITDGYGVKPNHNTRWPDVLAERLRAAPDTRGIGVINAGIGGNRMLLDGNGPNLLARFDRDVIARAGVRWAIVLEGVNDLGMLTRDAPASPAQHRAIVSQITAGYAELIARAHTHGIKVIGGTVMPFVGNDYYHADAQLEADRQAVNAYIRTSGMFDAVIDFDRAMRDPKRPDRLDPRYDSGDHLHPSEAGYRVMGELVPLAIFRTARR